MSEADIGREGSLGPEDGRTRIALSQPGRTGGHRVATSAYRGVCWHRKSRRWQSAINSSGRHVYLGSFDTEEEAARMFDKVAIRVRGSKAKLNFPYEDYVGPNGDLLTDPKLEQLVSEARKALVEKQRWLEAQDEAGTGSKRRRLGGLHSSGGAMDGSHLSSPSLGPIPFGLGLGPAPTELGLGVNLLNAPSISGGADFGLGAEAPALIGSDCSLGGLTAAAVLLTRLQQLERQLSGGQTGLPLQGALRYAADAGLGPASFLNPYGSNSLGGLAALLNVPNGGGSMAGSGVGGAAALHQLLPAAGLARNQDGAGGIYTTGSDADDPGMPRASPAPRAGSGGVVVRGPQHLGPGLHVGAATGDGTGRWLSGLQSRSGGDGQRRRSVADYGGSPPCEAPTPQAQGGLPPLIGRFLANVRQQLPSGMVLDALVPCTDTSLLGYTYVGLGSAGQPEPCARGASLGGPPCIGGGGTQPGCGSRVADADLITGPELHPRQRSASSDGSISANCDGTSAATQLRSQGAGAGVYFHGAYRDLGSYTTVEDSLQACQACMTVLLNFKELVVAEAAEVATAAMAPHAAAAPEALVAAADVHAMLHLSPLEQAVALGRASIGAGGIHHHLQKRQQQYLQQEQSGRLQQKRRLHQEFEGLCHGDNSESPHVQQHLLFQRDRQLTVAKSEDCDSVAYGSDAGGDDLQLPRTGAHGVQTEAALGHPQGGPRCRLKHEVQLQQYQPRSAQQDQEAVRISPQTVALLNQLLMASSQHAQGQHPTRLSPQQPTQSPMQRNLLPLLDNSAGSLEQQLAQHGNAGDRLGQRSFGLAMDELQARLPSGSSDSTEDNTGSMGAPQQLPLNLGVYRAGRARGDGSGHGAPSSHQGTQQDQHWASGRRTEDAGLAAAVKESGQSPQRVGFVGTAGQEQRFRMSRIPNSSGQTARPLLVAIR